MTSSSYPGPRGTRKMLWWRSIDMIEMQIGTYVVASILSSRNPRWRPPLHIWFCRYVNQFTTRIVCKTAGQYTNVFTHVFEGWRSPLSYLPSAEVRNFSLYKTLELFGYELNILRYKYSCLQAAILDFWLPLASHTIENSFIEHMGVAVVILFLYIIEVEIRWS